MEFRIGDQVMIKPHYQGQKWFYKKPLTIVDHGKNKTGSSVYFISPPLIYIDHYGECQNVDHISYDHVNLFKKREELRKEKIKEIVLV